MKPDTEWVEGFPLSSHVDLKPLVQAIQADALRHAESVAREICRRVQRDEGFHICNALEQEAIKIQNRFIARSDSQANKHC